MEPRPRHMRELERMFSSEIDGAMNRRSCLIQSRAKVYRELAQMGLAELSTETIAVDRFGAIKVTGYGLTHAGRLLYCASCADEPDEPATAPEKQP